METGHKHRRSTSIPVFLPNRRHHPQNTKLTHEEHRRRKLKLTKNLPKTNETGKRKIFRLSNPRHKANPGLKTRHNLIKTIKPTITVISTTKQIINIRRM